MTLNIRRCPSCLQTWRSGPSCRCGYALDALRRMPTIANLLTSTTRIVWNDVDLAAWTRMIWQLAQSSPASVAAPFPAAPEATAPAPSAPLPDGGRGVAPPPCACGGGEGL